MIHPSLNAICSDVITTPGSCNYDKCPWCEGCIYTHSETGHTRNSTSHVLHREVLDFSKWILPQPEEAFARQLTIERYRNAVLDLWPEAIVAVVGSTATGLYLPGSDINLTICGMIADDPSKALEILAKHFSSLQIMRKHDLVKSTRPILNLVDKPYPLRITISLQDTDGIALTKYVKYILNTYPAFCPFYLFVKYWLFQRRLDFPVLERISSDILFQLCLFTLQYTPREFKMNLGKVIPFFFSTFGNDFNPIVAGISTISEGQLFNRIESDLVDYEQLFSFCIEDPLSPGTFIHQLLPDNDRFQLVCQTASHNLMSAASQEHWILARVVNRPDWFIKRRNDLIKQFKLINGNALTGYPIPQSPPPPPVVMSNKKERVLRVPPKPKPQSPPEGVDPVVIKPRKRKQNIKPVTPHEQNLIQFCQQNFELLQQDSAQKRAKAAAQAMMADFSALAAANPAFLQPESQPKKEKKKEPKKEQKKEPKKEQKKEPKKEQKKEPKKEAKQEPKKEPKQEPKKRVPRVKNQNQPPQQQQPQPHQPPYPQQPQYQYPQQMMPPQYQPQYQPQQYPPGNQRQAGRPAQRYDMPHAPHGQPQYPQHNQPHYLPPQPYPPGNHPYQPYQQQPYQQAPPIGKPYQPPPQYNAPPPYPSQPPPQARMRNQAPQQQPPQYAYQPMTQFYPPANPIPPPPSFPPPQEAPVQPKKPLQIDPLPKPDHKSNAQPYFIDAITQQLLGETPAMPQGQPSTPYKDTTPLNNPQRGFQGYH